MPRGDYLGEFEQVVMLAVARLGEGAYGMAIVEELSRRTGNEPSVGSVYAALDRLERQGLVRSGMGEPTPERGGRAKRYFRLEPAGARSLAHARKVLDAL
jgi:DNA-binding PadR family transcriptional regulator